MKLFKWIVVALVLVIFTVPIFTKKYQNPEALAYEVQKNCASTGIGLDVICYARGMADIAEMEGPDYAFQTLFALQEINDYAKSCHVISHGIGEGTYRRSPDDWQNSIRTINQSCNYGAMHGIMENHIASLPGGSLTPQVIYGLCGSDQFNACSHILGHLILLETRADINSALEFCRVLEDMPHQAENCYNGVFMENLLAASLIEHDLVPDSWTDWVSRIDDLETMCRSYDGKEGVECWATISQVADRKFDHDPVKIFAFCDRSHLEEGKKQCKRHTLGIMAGYHKFDFEKLKPICEINQPNDPEFVRDCYVKLATTHLSYFPDKPRAIMDYCLEIPSKYQTSCFEAAELRKNIR